MYIYDFKFDDIPTIAYNYLLTHTDKYKLEKNFMLSILMLQAKAMVLLLGTMSSNI